MNKDIFYNLVISIIFSILFVQVTPDTLLIRLLGINVNDFYISDSMLNLIFFILLFVIIYFILTKIIKWIHNKLDYRGYASVIGYERRYIVKGFYPMFGLSWEYKISSEKHVSIYHALCPACNREIKPKRCFLWNLWRCGEDKSHFSKRNWKSFKAFKDEVELSIEADIRNGKYGAMIS